DRLLGLLRSPFDRLLDDGLAGSGRGVDLALLVVAEGEMVRERFARFVLGVGGKVGSDQEGDEQRQYARHKTIQSMRLHTGAKTLRPRRLTDNRRPRPSLTRDACSDCGELGEGIGILVERIWNASVPIAAVAGFAVDLVQHGM